MNNNRRDFLKKLPLAMSIPFTLGGIPLRAMEKNAPLSKVARAASETIYDTDRVLVILQLHGGNDGLNTLIPVDTYEQYQFRRPNIAIPRKNSVRKYIELDSTLPLESQVGLHPDMTALKAMYDMGRVTMVQGVSYKNNNGSHFRGRDIQFMGGSSQDFLTSGWAGRLINQDLSSPYPGDPPTYPNATYPDPLAIEMGQDTSLIFHQDQSIPVSIAINDPVAFATLVENLEGFKDLTIDPRGKPPEILDNSPYYNEMEWLLNLENQADKYAERMAYIYGKGGESSVTYPEKYPFNAPEGSYANTLSPQLKLIARMLGSNECKTKVFLVRLGGFDTHAEQVQSYDSTMGSHGALLYHLSTAMKAFQEDLRARGIEKNVLTVTTSEFGRRISSNGSYGTDHGTGGPLFVFGSGANPGVVGKVPPLDTNVPNVEMQFDYRLVYANIIRDWFFNDLSESDALAKLDYIFPGRDDPDDQKRWEWTPLPLAQQRITGAEGFVSSRFVLRDCYPNPVKAKTTFSFRVNAANNVKIEIMDTQGKKLKTVTSKLYVPGDHTEEADLSDLPAGSYIYELRSGTFRQSKKLVIVK